MFDVSIVYADYLDMDGDCYFDDILVIVQFDLGFSPIYEFYYLISLTLPSGIQYSYLVHVLAWADTIYIYNAFYDHATETGNYTVYVTALLLYPNSASDSVSHIFDPPGGSPGGRPTFDVF